MGDDGVEISFDAQLRPTGLLYEFAPVEQADREVLNQVYRVVRLPLMSAQNICLFGTPVDEARPPVQGGQFQREIITPELGRNAEGVEVAPNSLLRCFGQSGDLPAATAPSRVPSWLAVWCTRPSACAAPCWR